MGRIQFNDQTLQLFTSPSIEPRERYNPVGRPTPHPSCTDFCWGVTRTAMVRGKKSTNVRRAAPSQQTSIGSNPSPIDGESLADPDSIAMGETASAATASLVKAMAPLSLKRKAQTETDYSIVPRKRPKTGKVLVFGGGECAQLGWSEWLSPCGRNDPIRPGLTEEITERKFPAPVELADRIVSICCGGLHNIALTNDGEVWTWGCNDEKALGRSGDEWVPGKVTH